jgi:hypothetical protein
MDKNKSSLTIDVKVRRQLKPFKKQGIFTKRQITMLENWILNPKTRFISNLEIAKRIGKSKASLWRAVKKHEDNPLNELTLRELTIILDLYNEDVLKKEEPKSDGSKDSMSGAEKARLKELLKD